jgi:hypothetical protein
MILLVEGFCNIITGFLEKFSVYVWNPFMEPLVPWSTVGYCNMLVSLKVHLFESPTPDTLIRNLRSRKYNLNRNRPEKTCSSTSAVYSVQCTATSDLWYSTCDPTQSTMHSGQRSQCKLSFSALWCLCKATLSRKEPHKNCRYINSVCNVLLWMLHQLPTFNGIHNTAKSGRMWSTVV